MRPLSTFVFLKSCFSKVFPMVATVSLSVAALYFMGMFVSQLDETVNEASVYGYEKASIIISGKSGFSDKDLQTMKMINKDLDNYIIMLGGVSHKSIIGYTSTDILMSDKDGAAAIFKHMGFQLLEGNLPASQNEIIIHDKIRKAYGLQVGDRIDKGRENWYLDENAIVTGIYAGKAVMGIGITRDENLIVGGPYTSYYICGSRDKLSSIDPSITEQFAKTYRVYTYESQKEKMKQFNVPINAMKVFLGVILVIAIGVFLTNITSVQYANRRKELQLLNAIGYTRRQLIHKALREIAMASLTGYLVGIILAIILGLTLNIIFFNDAGTDMPLFLPGSMMTVGLVPIAIIWFGMLAPVRNMRFRDI